MHAPQLNLDDYQARASRSDRTGDSDKATKMAILGLFGEVGSLLSEVKKRQRDALSYVGYEQNVVEEFGDALWYLATIASHANVKLSDLAQDPSNEAAQVSGGAFFANLQPQAKLPLNTPTVAFETNLLSLAGAVGELCGADEPTLTCTASLSTILRRIFKRLLAAADEAEVSLEDAALRNLAKADDRWPVERMYPEFFDKNSPPEEQLPRQLEIHVYERSVQGKKYVVQSCNGILIGDRLTDNIMKPDDYRFHDAFHYAYAAVLGWSPVVRALLRLKRKSAPAVDEGQDGARAILIEEGVATFIFGEAKQLEFFQKHNAGDLGFTFLKTVRQFVRGYEPEACPLWLWEEAIIQGNRAFCYLKEERRGRLLLDLDSRRLTVEKLP